MNEKMFPLRKNWCIKGSGILSFLFFFILIIACEKENPLNEEAIRVNKAKLIDFQLSGNLLSNVQNGKSGTTLNFETETLVLSNDWFDRIEKDIVGWKSTIFFKDNTSVVVGMIGDTLIVDETVEINPSSYCPLSAKITFSTPAKGNIKITILSRNGKEKDIEHVYDFWDSSHDIVILGLYPDFKNTINVSFLDKRNRERANTTLEFDFPPLSKNLGLPTIELIKSNPERMEDGFTLISYPGESSMSTSIPFMIDSNGEVRWLLDMREHPELKNMKYGNGIERLNNGNLYFSDRNTNTIFEIDMLGNVISKWLIPVIYGFHHNVQEKTSGNFLISVTKKGSLHLNGNKTDKDFVIEIDRNSGNVITEWDLRESLDETRMVLIDPKEPMNKAVNWAHVNAVYPSEKDNTILVSCRFQGLVKLTYDNKVKWIISSHKGWGVNRRQESMVNYLLQPLDLNDKIIEDQSVLLGDENHSDFEWIWGQHSPSIMPNGNIAMFDNGYMRNYTEKELYSRAVVYEINERNKTIKQVWQYGKNRAAETFSRAVSDVDYLPLTNNILFCPGKGLQNPGGIGGRIIEIDYNTNEVVFEVAINAGSDYAFQRAERFPLYFK